MRNAAPVKAGWTHVFAKGKQFLSLIRYTPNYSYSQDTNVVYCEVINSVHDENKFVNRKWESKQIVVFDIAILWVACKLKRFSIDIGGYFSFLGTTNNTRTIGTMHYKNEYNSIQSMKRQTCLTYHTKRRLPMQ